MRLWDPDVAAIVMEATNERSQHTDDESVKNKIDDPNDKLKDLYPQVAPVINMLYPGCGLQARYNDFHTVRIQFAGAAGYILFPPDAVKDLKPFPSTHLSAYQSQVSD